MLPPRVAVDGAGNLYIIELGSNAIKKWSASSGVTTLVSGLNSPSAFAVDGAGNLYIAEIGNNDVKK